MCENAKMAGTETRTWVKICGLTSNGDALAAVELGADAVGVVVYPASPRAVLPEQIPGIVAGVPAGVRVYALFVNPTAELVRGVIAGGGINRLQFHGDEAAEFCASFGLPYMKAIRVGGSTDQHTASTAAGAATRASLLARINAYPEAEAILLDSFAPGAPGGTGKQFDWHCARGLQAQLSQPLILAGGLNATNVAAAIALVQPAGVDVSSGVEATPGRARTRPS